MIVKSLELENYRNYENLKIHFDAETNILYGNNAQGKTNILEAIYLCAVSRSHRGSKDRELISFDKEEAHIKCFVEKKGFCDRIDIHLKKKTNKGIALNGIPLKRASELFGILNAVFFSPEDLSIIKKGPSERRRFIDMELCQLDYAYTAALTNYNKIITQKNQLLKDLAYKPELRDTLDVWNRQMAIYGEEIIRRRRTFIDHLNPIMKEIHASLTNGEEDISLFYEECCGPDDFYEQLKKEEEREIRMRVSLIGPHRDDIKFSVGDMDIRRFGSQGQQRTAALSLKLSEIEFIKRNKNDSPILLLDDVLSELDRSRQMQLLKRIQGIQTIITCTGVDDFVDVCFPVNKVFRVEKGVVYMEN